MSIIADPVEVARSQLAAPLPTDQIYWRVGAKTQDKKRGLALAYMDARGVMNRLDEVFGIDGWEDAYVETPTNRIICTLSVTFGSDVAGHSLWVHKSDGAGMTDVEGEKGAISDALKRTAVKLGIGRYLYNLPAVWVPIEPWGKSHRIVPGEEPELPEWARPAGAPPAGQKKASMPTKEQQDSFLVAVHALMQVFDTKYTVDVGNLIFDELVEATGFRSLPLLASKGTRAEHEVFYGWLKAKAEEEVTE